MDEETAIIDNNTRNEKIRNFFVKNRKILSVIIIVIVSTLLGYFVFAEYKENQKLKISDQYNSITTEYSEKNKEETKNLLIELIYKNDSTYSPLSLYFIIDNKLIIKKKKINDLFDNIIKKTSLDKEIKNLIIYKKALFNSEFETENNLLNILSPILNSKSVWKSHSLYLMAEYFYSKKEKIKSKEFFDKILNLEDGNMQIKQEAQKRIKRDFSE